jgi:hypothetical protein
VVGELPGPRTACRSPHSPATFLESPRGHVCKSCLRGLGGEPAGHARAKLPSRFVPANHCAESPTNQPITRGADRGRIARAPGPSAGRLGCRERALGGGAPGREHRQRESRHLSRHRARRLEAARKYALTLADFPKRRLGKIRGRIGTSAKLLYISMRYSGLCLHQPSPCGLRLGESKSRSDADGLISKLQRPAAFPIHIGSPDDPI